MTRDEVAALPPNVAFGATLLAAIVVALFEAFAEAWG